MYKLHHTEGVVLAARNSGDADRFYIVFTRDYGKVALFAKSVRLEKSKLRCHLRPSARARLTFIEGNELLRLTDAEEIEAPPADDVSYAASRRAARFLDRMVSGQERDAKLWTTTASAFSALTMRVMPAVIFQEWWEARVLHRLGYITPPEGKLGEYIVSDEWSALPDVGRAALAALRREALWASNL